MKLLILLAFVAAGHCALLGSKKCTYGPSYWCSHIHHAKECNALQHCMSTVWNKQVTGMTGSTETCFDVIKVLDAVRKSSDADMPARMAVGCTGMPAEKRAVCKDLMTHDVEEVHLLLKSELPSMQIASALGLCGGFPDTMPHPLPQVAGDYCTDCVAFFGDIREIFNKSEGQAESMIKSLVCSKVGPLENLCDQLVDQYAAMVYQLVYQQLNPKDLCMLLQLCANQSRADLMDKLKELVAKRGQSGSMECELCKEAAQEAQSALRDTTLQNDILTALETSVCPLLPGDLGTQCKTYVSQYGPLVFQVLVAELDPATICQTIGFCNATRAEKPLISIPLISTGAMRLAVPKAEVKVGASPQCSLCEFIMDKLESMITTNATESEIEAALEKVCSLLPATLSQECSSFVEQYGPLVINLLIHEATPAVVCTSLGLCVGTAGKDESNMSHAATKPLHFQPMMGLQRATKVKAALLGDEKCTYGPSYWCASVENAKKCNAVDHCVKVYNMKVDA